MSEVTYKCYDCGFEEENSALSRTWMVSCSKCIDGMMMVYTFDGEPSNRDYFPEGENINE